MPQRKQDANFPGTYAGRWVSQSLTGMRSGSAAQLTSLGGSIGLHACAVLVLLLAARRPPPVPATAPPERPDPWLGASAVEVDAVATPDATPNIANAASSPE